MSTRTIDDGTKGFEDSNEERPQTDRAEGRGHGTAEGLVGGAGGHGSTSHEVPCGKETACCHVHHVLDYYGGLLDNNKRE